MFGLYLRCLGLDACRGLRRSSFFFKVRHLVGLQYMFPFLTSKTSNFQMPCTCRNLRWNLLGTMTCRLVSLVLMLYQSLPVPCSFTGVPVMCFGCSLMNFT